MKAYVHVSIILLSLSLIFGVFSVANAGDSTKIGIIDLQQCLNDSKEGIKAKKLLETKNAKLKLRFRKKSVSYVRNRET